MASDLARSTRRPRAATTTLPTMVPSSPTTQQSLRGPSSMYGGSPPLGSGEHDVTSAAQAPLRHPKPLTPSDLHLVLEKEQEAMVNRLTRELSLLRQQTASVASTASSTSTLNDVSDGIHGSPSLSSTHSHSSRRQRSSSSLSSHTPSVQGAQGGINGIAPSRTVDNPRSVRSREPSLTHRRPSIGTLNSYTQHPHPDHIANYGNSPSIYPHRTSVSQTHLGLSSSSLARYEEAAMHKQELETARRENEQLRRRVRELEQVLKKQKEDPLDL
ncbi:hypothetical protein N7528_007823 [Penicillium herquei]|nr:hypothetical protein N7528_007823 [Penicillium herquei]